MASLLAWVCCACLTLLAWVSVCVPSLACVCCACLALLAWASVCVPSLACGCLCVYRYWRVGVCVCTVTGVWVSVCAQVLTTGADFNEGLGRGKYMLGLVMVPKKKVGVSAPSDSPDYGEHVSVGVYVVPHRVTHGCA